MTEFKVSGYSEEFRRAIPVDAWEVHEVVGGVYVRTVAYVLDERLADKIAELLYRAHADDSSRSSS